MLPSKENTEHHADRYFLRAFPQDPRSRDLRLGLGRDGKKHATCSAVSVSRRTASTGLLGTQEPLLSDCRSNGEGHQERLDEDWEAKIGCCRRVGGN